MVQRVQQDDQDDEETHSLPRLPLLDSEPYNFSAGHGQAIADQACSPTSQSEREREGLTRRRFGRMSADHSSKSSKGNDENGFRNDPSFFNSRILFFSFFGFIFASCSILSTFRAVFHRPSSSSLLPSSSFNPPSDPSLLATSLLPSKELSNGTHPWRKTVLLISLDGVRPSYLTRRKMPNLFNLGMPSTSSSSSSDSHQVGSLLAESMIPVFPTLTFPNHWSILTGLNAEDHGIIGNNFYLPENTDGSDAPLAGKSFHYTDPTRSWDPRWWKGQPIWAAAERAGVPSSIIAWPGPPVTSGGDRPSFFQKYEPQWKLKDRYNQISDWLDLEIEKRPQLICTYVPDVDQLGHKSGSNSVDDALSRVDLFIASLSDLIGSRNLSQIMDLIIVSDRGMTDTSTSRLVYLDKVLGSELFSQIQSQDIWPNVGLHFEGGAELGKKRLETAERILREASKSHGSGGGKAFKVYRKEEIPESWGWKKSSRLAELLLIPETGWSFTNEEEMRIHSIDGVYQPLGNHGYSVSSPEMAAIFVASGPSFKQSGTDKGRSAIKAFPNLEIYNLVCALLGIPEKARAPNNGTKDFWDKYLET